MTEYRHEGFCHLIRDAKGGELQPAWAELLERALPVLIEAAEDRLPGSPSSVRASLITDVWLAVSRRIHDYEEGQDDGATYRSFVEWVLSILDEFAGQARQFVPETTSSGEAAGGTQLRDIPLDALLSPETEGHTYAEDADPGDQLSYAKVSPAPQPPIDDIHFAVYAPPVVCPGSQFLLCVWAFLEKQREEMSRRAEQRSRALVQAGSQGPLAVPRGSDLRLHVTLNGLRVQPVVDGLCWNGEIANTAFEITVPEHVPPGWKTGLIRILCCGRQIAQVHFEIHVGETASPIAELSADRKCIHSVFASYAREDQQAVLNWIRGVQFAGTHVCADVLVLREGQDWERELMQQVPSHDLFCLFWSEAASRSKWVEKEWRCALTKRGCAYIHPVPLVAPHLVPPPVDLARCLHFDDLMRMVMDATRR